MTLNRYLFVFLSTCFVFASQRSLGTNALTGLTVTSRPIDGRVVSNLMAAYDAGDGYRGAKGRRSLLRLPNALSVRVDRGEAGHARLAALTASGGALAGFAVEVERKDGFALLRSEVSQSKSPAAAASDLATVRQSPGVVLANPVFIEPASGLWAMTTDEIIVALKPGLDAQSYFGADWIRVRPLIGSQSQYLLTLPSAESEAVFAAVERHSADPRVAWAEPDFISQGLSHLIPNDPEFANQWHLRNTGQTGGTAGADIRATTAWDRTNGSRSVIIAVLDSGFDLAHPDLISNLATNAQEIAGNGLDDDGNGYIDDIRGWDFYAPDNDPNPTTAFDSHGTICAGAAAAAGNNAIGVTGVAYGCRWMPLRIGESINAGQFASRDSDIAAAIYYAAGGVNQSDSWRGADVLSLSFESFQATVVDNAITFATEQAHNGQGVPIFVATGNHGDGWQTIALNGFPAGTFTFAWTYSKNAANAAGEDAVWLAQVNFPGGTVERFDGAIFPPAGWTTSGNANWTRPSDPAHSRGPSQLIPRSGAIGDNQSTTLQTTQTIGAGSMTYLCWVSSEAGADIFSFSLNGTPQPGVNASGVPFIRSGPSYPGTHPNVITVGASTHWDTRASYSQIGGKLDFLATGGGNGGASTVTTDRTGTSGYNTGGSPGGDYFSAEGTSLATPVAAGVGALMLSVAPNLTAAQVRDILRTTADKVGPVPYTNGWNAYYGAGRINASNALAVAAANNCNGAPAIVNNLSDSGAGSLRDAIQRINSGCSTSILFTASGTINLASSLPLITRSAVISGPGTNQLTINGGGAYSLFQFGPNTTNRITGVRLVNGFSTDATSAVWNRGRTIIDSCVFSSNVTVGVLGGAIGNFSANPSGGALFVTNCTFYRNVCVGLAGESRSAGNNGGPGGGGAGMGGAIYSEGWQLVLSSCNFDANVAGGGNGGNGDANGFGNDTGGNGGSPNGGVGGAAGLPGGDGGFGGGGGGGAGSFNLTGQPGGAGGFGGGGGGGGARGSGGNGGTGGNAGIYAGAGGAAFASHSGGGGGGAGLGGAVFARTGAVVIASCNFIANRATNGVGGAGSFGGGNGGLGQGRGGALFGLDAIITGVNLTFTGNLASTASPDVEVPTVVTTTSDDGLGSLRQAIRNAALRPGADTITFMPSLSGSVVSLTTAQLDVTDAGPLTVSAAGLPAGIGITGNGARRAFEIFGGATLTLDSLTLFNCFASFGGAVINSGHLTVRSCTIVSNLAEFVGAIYNVGGNSLVVHSSTIANNSATNLDGAVFSYGPLEIRHSTIVNNRATNAGGGVRFDAAAILEHNIIAGNSSPLDPDLGDFGVLNGLARYNFVGNGSGSTLANGVNGNRVGTPGAPLNPQLSALKYFGGPTAVLHPLPGSPLIDAGDPALAGVISDQRGWPRVSGGRADIGAVEYAPAAGYSVLFDGVNDFLILSNAALSLPTNEVTVEFWERVATVREQFSFILFPDVTTDRFAFSSVRVNGTTYWDFGDLFNSGRVAYNGVAGSILNQWTHWAVVSSQASNSMRIYRNGKLDASSTTNRSFVRYAAALVLGARLDAGGQEFFQGEIDEFRIWSVARTQTEIQSGMNFGLCPPQANLWVYWKFNEPSGDIVYDYSGNNRHGLLFNGVTRAISLAPLYPPGTATMALLNPSQVQVSWSPNSGCLESAVEVTGPWTAVSGATNGQTISTSLDRQFFRVSQ